MTEGLHWLYRGTPRMDFTPMTSKKYVSVTGWRIWEGLVCVCVCVFLFIHSYIQFSPQNSFQHLLVSFSLHPTFKTFKVQTPEMQTISMQAIFCHAVLFTNTFFSIYEWTALYTTDSVLLNTKLPQGFELLVYITWAHVGISRYMFLSAPWFLWILIFVLLTNEGVDNRRNEGNIPFSAAL